MVHLYFKHVLLLCRDVDKKIKVVLGSTPPSKAFFRLNQLFLEEFKNKIKYLMKRNYIRTSKSPYGALVLFEDKNNNIKSCHLCFFGVGKLWIILMESILGLKIMKK